uniref:Uncharacterized protein n=1 Tax=uncultured Desulfobacterium sp. TaxID=201089 RepID=E1YMJ9_9BACT|nr:unknown protein [uncultured Desulfobacterium sp.]
MKKYIVTLTKDEREALGELTTKGKHRVIVKSCVWNN